MAHMMALLFDFRRKWWPSRLSWSLHFIAYAFSLFTRSMQVFILLVALFLLNNAQIICKKAYMQPATSPSSSLPLKTTPLPSRNGSPVPSSEPVTKQSSVLSRETTKRPPTPSPSPPRFPDCPTWHTASRTIEVLQILFRQWLYGIIIFRDKENRAHSSHLLSVDPDLRNH